MKLKRNFLIIGFTSYSYLVHANQTTLENADKFYQEGNCEKAIENYNQLADTKLKSDEVDRITFRTAYCQFSLGNYLEAEKGFNNYLLRNKNDEEALLKYSQSLLNNGKLDQADQIASSIKSNDFKFDAKIVKARVRIESEKFDEAFAILNSEASNPEAIY